MFDLSPTEDPTRFRWIPSPLVLTPRQTVQGGAGLGAAAAAMEVVTGRPVVWATAQYLSFAFGTEPIDIEVTVEVAGHNTTQARCVLSRKGGEVLTAHAALGRREFEFDGVWATRPDVPPPDDCPSYRYFGRGHGALDDLAEFRLAHGRQLETIDAEGGRRGDGSFALWIRCWEGEHAVTVPDIAFIGDFMPVGFADALGQPFGGNSLDNTIRIGQLATTRWVLLATQIQQVASGFGYGHAQLWAQDGTLIADVSQTCVMRSHTRLRDNPRRSVG